MPTARRLQTFDFPGPYSFQGNQSPVTFDHPNTYVVESIAAGKAGTLSTRTDNNTGTLTLSSGHGIATADIIDLYWSGGVRYGVVVGSVSGTSVPIDLGSGTNLPAQDTAVVACEQVRVNTLIDASAVKIVGVFLECSTNSAAKAHVDFQDNADASVYAASLVRSDQSGGFNVVADVANGDSNPFGSTDIARCMVSNGTSTDTMTIYILIGEDSTP